MNSLSHAPTALNPVLTELRARDTFVALGTQLVSVKDKPYGAKGDRVADDTAAIAAAIAATPVGGVLLVPAGFYKLASAIAINKHITIVGGGVSSNFLPLAQSSSFDYPTVAPYLYGTVFVQTTAGANIIEITKAGVQVNLRDFGGLFDDPILFGSTGHGIYAVPSTMSGGGHDHGWINGQVSNVQIFGHGPGKYGLYCVNPMLVDTSHFRSYGAGGMHIECDSTAGDYGNMVHTAPYVSLIVRGSHDGYNLVPRTGSGVSGQLTFITFIRPQSNADDASSYFSGLLPPQSSQYIFRANSPAPVNYLKIVAGDFETALGLPVGYPPIGTPGLDIDDATTPGLFGTPSVALGAGAGAGATVSLAAGSTDKAGVITFTTGTGSTRWSNLFKLTYGRLSSNSKVAIILTPATADAAASQPYLTGYPNDGFVVGANTTPTDARTLTYHYVVKPF